MTIIKIENLSTNIVNNFYKITASEQAFTCKYSQSFVMMHGDDCSDH